jgi:hydroxymethylbilane synthase
VGAPALRLGTRGSALARAQTELVRASLAARHPGLALEVVYIRTSGDRGALGAPGDAGLKGLFVKEIEEALLAGTVDVGVHSMKDMPARLAPGLALGAVPERGAPPYPLLSWGA